MLDGRHHAVVVGSGRVASKVRAGAPASVRFALKRVLDRKLKSRSLIGGRGTRCTGGTWLYCGRPCCNDAGAASAPGPPDSGDEYGRAYPQTDGGMIGSVPNVLQLELPATAELLLDAGCPLNRVGRVVLGGQENVLGLSEELRRSGSRDLRLGKRIGSDLTDGPWAAEAYRTGGRCLCLADGGGIGRVLLVPLAGEEVDLVIAQRRTRAHNCFACAEGI